MSDDLRVLVPKVLEKAKDLWFGQTRESWRTCLRKAAEEILGDDWEWEILDAVIDESSIVIHRRLR